jgi:hypothetical protein
VLIRYTRVTKEWTAAAAAAAEVDWKNTILTLLNVWPDRLDIVSTEKGGVRKFHLIPKTKIDHGISTAVIGAEKLSSRVAMPA